MGKEDEHGEGGAAGTGCCPRFDPGPWDDKVHEWKDRRFIRGKVVTFFHIPLNFGGVMRRLDRTVREAGATMPDALVLSDHTSRWRMEIFLAVDREIPGAENVTLSGRFLTKVYEGPYGDTGKWCKAFESYVEGKGLDIKKWYMGYTTCPGCAKAYGKNYVVLVAEV
ncbi:MAG: hypothetical protein L0Z54_05200 [Thermoplasmata archaeon]|nr:hypothetical protein [Thermoplasmata archaeon]